MRPFLLQLFLILLVATQPAARGQTFEMLFSDNQGLCPTGNLVQGDDGNFYGTTEIGGASNKGTIFKVTPAGVYTTLVSFHDSVGVNPRSGLVKGSDGNFYGTTFHGGVSGYGTVFKVTPAGALTTLVSFDVNGSNGTNPEGGLVEGNDGNFYGTTSFGVADFNGTIFRVTPDGVLTTLVHFDGTNGKRPTATMVKGSDGNFYGTTTEGGGTSGSGTVFKMTSAGVLSTLAVFDWNNGSSPSGGLVQGRDGNFYGTTFAGGASMNGTVFKVSPTGGLTTLAHFNNTNGRKSSAAMLQGRDGNFYGTTSEGGENGYGTVFRITPTGVLTRFVSFAGSNGRTPLAGLVEGNDGNFYGTTYFGGATSKGTIFKITPAGELATLASLDSTIGGNPRSGVVEGKDGNFYGTTEFGGLFGNGTIFKVTRTGVVTTLVSFNSTDGRNPRAGLVEGDDGSFYGTTYSGGASDFGTIFKVTSTGDITTLLSFSPTTGTNPSANLVLCRDGDFYGTTEGGGANGYGSVFRVTPAGVLTRLASFTSSTGSGVRAGLLEASDGNFYGTTYYGGSGSNGTVFKVTLAGELSTLASFSGEAMRFPVAGLVEGRDGNFYGTTEFGYSPANDNGTVSGNGAVFKVTPAGQLTRLVAFNWTNGSSPRAGLALGRDGNLYGTTTTGGVSGNGTIFKVTPAGVLTTLHSFDGFRAALPEGSPIFASDGDLYGMASKMAVWRVSFTSAPLATTNSPSIVTRTGAILSGSVNASGADTEVFFEFGLTPESGNRISATPGTVTGKAATVVGVVLSSLAPSTTYYYRLIATNSEGMTSTAWSSFTTGNNLPVAVGDRFTPEGNEFGMMKLAVLENDSDADGDPLTITGVTQGALGSVVTDGTTLSYTPGTGFLGRDTFSYSVSDGTGTVIAQVEIRAKVPFTRAQTPNAVAVRDATISGVVNASGSETTVIFEYGPTPEYGNSIAATPGTVIGTSATDVSATLSGLSPHTTYYYRITASNSEGTTSSHGASFTTTNSLPTPANDSLSPIRDESGTIRLSVLGNDVDADGDTLTITAVTQGALGFVSTDGKLLTYIPGPEFRGRDTFSYAISDGIDTAVAQVELQATAPVPRLLIPNAVTTNSATFNGTVNANWAESTAVFEFGLTESYGSSIAAAPGRVTGMSETAVSANISGLAPHTKYYYRLTASNMNGSMSSVGASFTTANSRPVATGDRFVFPNSFGAIPLQVLANDNDADGDSLMITAVTQGSLGTVTTDGNTVTYTPALGGVGHDTFSYTISDGIETATAQVELQANVPFSRVLFTTGGEVPGAGQVGSEIPAGALFRTFGIPSVNSAGQLTFSASYGVPGTPGELSIVGIDPLTSRATLIAGRSQAAPGTHGARFSSFKDPLLNETGDIAFLATLFAGDTTKANNQGLWVSSRSTGNNLVMQLVARTGAQPPGVPAGARWKSFTNVALASSTADTGADESGWLLVFTAFMAPGRGTVNASNDMGLWIARSANTLLALREGQKLQIGGTEKKLRTFGGLMPLSNAPGQGNGATNRGGMAVQAFFTDGSQALLRVSLADAGENVIVEAIAFPGDPVVGSGETADRFGLPTQSGSGTVTAWIGKLSGKGNIAAVFERNLSEPELLNLLARKGDSAPGIGGGSFSAFRSVAVTDLGSALMIGKVTGKGISSSSDEGIWWMNKSGDNASLQLVAREGGQPPGIPQGARWKTFTSVALPEGQSGPIFTATLAAGSRGKAGPGGITSSNDQGLWAVDSNGELQLIAQEGQELIVDSNGTRKTLRSYTVLSAVSGSPTQRRSYDGNGRIVYRALLTDGSQAIIAVQLP